MNICVYTLGCKVNQYESDAIMTALLKNGFFCTTKLEKADIYIINTCAVTNEAEKKSRGIVNRALKLNENAKIIVCGCASQNNTAQFLKNKNVSLILGIKGKNKIDKILDRVGNLTEELNLEYDEFSSVSPSKTRAYLKIQDGCNNFCSYCLIPYVRGRSRSRELDKILEEAKTLSKTAREIVITGINLSDYKINNELSLKSLCLKLKEVNARIRFGSLEMNIIDEEFLSILKSMPNFCPQFHLSMQSGCDRILKLMNRHYTSAEFLGKVELINKHFDNASITTDVIVGFPTETNQDFEETVATIKKAKFFNMHIFPYSIRNGTVAEKMQQVEPNIKTSRAKTLKKINQELKTEFLNSQIGKTEEMLTEEMKDGYTIGHSKNYVKCYLKGQFNENELVKIKFIKPFKDGMIVEKE